RWLGAHPGYTLAKYGMTLATLGIAAEHEGERIRANCLWPRTLIATDAIANVLGGQSSMSRARTPEIMADAAYSILTDPLAPTGQMLIDEDVLRARGVDDFSRYAPPGERAELELELDLFLDEPQNLALLAETSS